MESGNERLDCEGDAFKNSAIITAFVGRNLKNTIFRDNTVLEKVKFADGIKMIPYNCFSGCTNLYTVELSKVEDILNSAFSDCKSLKALDLSSVVSIKSDVFCGCQNLKNVTFRKVQYIYDNAFANSGISHVDLPTSLVELGKNVFWQCDSLKSVKIQSKITAIPEGSFDGCDSLKQIDYPNSVLTIGKRAFAETGLASFVFNDAVQEIGDFAFSKCVKLEDVKWGKVSIIGKNAFESTGLAALQLPQNVTVIKSEAFAACQKLSKVDLSQTRVSNIASFPSCTQLNDVKLPQTLSSIGYRCFSFCSSLSTIGLVDATDTIGKEAFLGCSNLTELRNTENVKFIFTDAFKETQLYKELEEGPLIIGSVLYRYDGIIKDKTYILPSNVTCIANAALSNQNFQTVKLNEGLKYVGSGAFDGCKNLISLTIPNTVTDFYSSTGLESLTVLNIEKGSSSLWLDGLIKSNVKKLYLGRQTSSIDWMPELESLSLSKYVQSIVGSFSNSLKLETLELEDTISTLNINSLPIENIKSFYWGRPIVYDKYLPEGWNEERRFVKLQDVTIGKYVDVIPDNFVKNNEYLEEVDVPATVTQIGAYAFSGLKKIAKLTLHEGLVSVRECGFAHGTSSLIDCFYVPGTLREMGYGAFMELKCKKIVLAEGLGELGTNAFCNLQTDSLTLPSTLKLNFQSFEFSTIKYLDASRYKGLFKSSFTSCVNLEKVIMPKEGMTVLSENEFWGCKALKSIELPNTIDSISHSVFGGTQIHEVHIPSSVRLVGGRMFCMTNGTKLPYKPVVYVDGCVESAPIGLNGTFQDDYGLELGKLDVSKSICYDFSDAWYPNSCVLNMDSLVLRNVKEFKVKTEMNSHFAPNTAICLSPYLTSCDLWKPTNGKILVLPGSQLPKEDTMEMYTVNKLNYEQSTDGNVLFDGVNNMPYEIAPIFYQEGEEVELREAGIYDLSMKISGTSFDGTYPTGLKVSVSSTSGINNVMKDDDNRQYPIYNMNGQRVDSCYKGVIIQNGMKRIAK